MDRLSDFRSVFADAVVARAACRDPRIRDAFARVPRHAFVGDGPWRLSEDGPLLTSADPALFYQDFGLGIAPERDIPTGLPSLHARCMEACAPSPGERVVHVGAGLGYFTAILAELVGPRGSVQAFEIDPLLAEAARKNLAPWPAVRVEARSAVEELETADVIYACAGAQEIPRPWVRALRLGGRLLLPLTPGNREGGVLLVTRMEPGFTARFVSRARFVPCVGATSAAASAALSIAFARGDSSAVRSLRFAPESPIDETCWYAGEGFWLSRANAE